MMDDITEVCSTCIKNHCGDALCFGNNYCNWQPKQADGEYISKTELLKAIDTWDKFGIDDTNSLFRLDSLSLPHYVPYIHYDDVVKYIKGMQGMSIPQDHDGCENCRWQSQSETEMPCKQCMHNYTDEWEMKKPTETITMTREEFNEKLMEHYRQGRADEKAYQNGEIMQSFNPD